MMSERPELVIFDCDGILVDTENTANKVLSSWLAESGYPVTFEECRTRFSGRSMKSVQEEIEAGGHLLGFSLMDRWYSSLDEIFGNDVEMIPHIEHVIDTLRQADLPWCVASSAKMEKMQLTLGSTGLMRHFQDVLFSATMVERGKPFPDLFLFAADKMGYTPQQCVVIEDSLPGTRAGISAGMRVFSYHGDAYSDPAGMKQAGGILFDDMRTLPSLLGI